MDGARDQVCLLDVPAHKTGAPSPKPVDALVGKAIDAWGTVREKRDTLFRLLACIIVGSCRGA